MDNHRPVLCKHGGETHTRKAERANEQSGSTRQEAFPQGHKLHSLAARTQLFAERVFVTCLEWTGSFVLGGTLGDQS